MVRVRSYPKLGLDEESVRELRGDYVPYAEVVALRVGGASNLPVCRDLDDQPFLVLAHGGNADVLVTGDKARLGLDGKTGFKIVDIGWRTRIRIVLLVNHRVPAHRRATEHRTEQKMVFRFLAYQWRG